MSKMVNKRVREVAASLGLLVLAILLSGCAGVTQRRYGHRIYVSVPDQKLIVLKETPDPETKEVRLHYVTEYPVSTSKFGLGSQPNSNRTPLGKHTIAKKIGGGAPLYANFKDRRLTGEIVPPNTPGRDPIVTRILWLKGAEPQNANSYGRYIYIHGTAEENKIGRPASYGCIRMKSIHVAQLYQLVSERDEVIIVNKRLNPAAYLPPPGTPNMAPVPAGTPGTPGAYMGPPQANNEVKPKVKATPAPVVKKETPQAPQQLAIANPPAIQGSGGAGIGESPTWVAPNRKVAKYQRKGVNPKKIFE